MKVKDLDGNITIWKIKNSNINYSKSNNHNDVKNLLQQQYPTTKILEEVQFSVRPNCYLYFDFYLPLLNIAVEIHGEQHFKYIPHFHGNRIGFLKQLGNDRDKEDWCSMNNIQLIILRYDETINDWIAKLNR